MLLWELWLVTSLMAKGWDGAEGSLKGLSVFEKALWGSSDETAHYTPRPATRWIISTPGLSVVGFMTQPWYSQSKWCLFNSRAGASRVQSPASWTISVLPGIRSGECIWQAFSVTSKWSRMEHHGLERRAQVCKSFNLYCLVWCQDSARNKTLFLLFIILS